MAAEQVLAKPVGGRGVPLETEIKRYAKPYQRRLRKLAKTSSRLGDLIGTFPAAAFALVSGYGSPAQRGEAVQMVKNGESLKKVAQALDLPFWMRRLPPEAFAEPLSGGICGAEEGFARKIVNALPEGPANYGQWLAWVDRAMTCGDEKFVLWIAGLPIYKRKPGVASADPALVELLAAFAWYSRQNSRQKRSALIDARWNPRMPLLSASLEIGEWLLRVLSQRCLDLPRVTRKWTEGQKVKGMNFVPLTTASALEDEGRVMNHCVGSYAAKVAAGHCLIFSIRDRGQRVATLEIVASHASMGEGLVNQLYGPSNSPVSPQVLSAVEEWLRRQGPVPLVAFNDRTIARALMSERWDAFWQPFWDAHGAQSVIRPQPDSAAIYHLNRSLVLLERLGRQN
ncbi:MAG: PcfJ domain-containing protein [Neomegalonema sp.]|nr:PcfJ domain-containing protein [Neomegalonema sp.]